MSQPDRQRQSKIDKTSAIFLNRQRFISVFVMASGLRANGIVVQFSFREPAGQQPAR